MKGVTYTNRKGQTYHLAQGITKTGKPRYFFTREAPAEPVLAIPAERAIEESINGLVSLVKLRPTLIREEETQVISAALSAHPQGDRYRMEAKQDAITVYERSGTDPLVVATALRNRLGGWGVDMLAARRLQEESRDRGRFDPVMRFVLLPDARRRFLAQRMTYRGEGGWQTIIYGKNLSKLAAKLIPTLGTDAFFELM